MHLCYLDESGTPEIGSQTSHFVLLGLAIPATAWLDYDQRIDAIKSKYGLKGVEIHTGYLARRYSEQEKVQAFSEMDWLARKAAVQRARENELIRTATLKKPDHLKELKKNFRKTAEHTHLGHAERAGLLQELADEMGRWQNAELFGCGVDKRSLLRPALPEEIYERAFHSLRDMFGEFLASFPKSLGLIISDNNQTVAKRITERVRQLHQKPSPLGARQIIETPLFVDSSLTSMVQMADLCAYATRRYFENEETDLFNRIFTRFDLRLTGQARLYHFTGSQTCHCKVCQVVNAPLW